MAKILYLSGAHVEELGGDNMEEAIMDMEEVFHLLDQFLSPKNGTALRRYRF